MKSLNVLHKSTTENFIKTKLLGLIRVCIWRSQWRTKKLQVFFRKNSKIPGGTAEKYTDFCTQKLPCALKWCGKTKTLNGQALADDLPKTNNNSTFLFATSYFYTIKVSRFSTKKPFLRKSGQCVVINFISSKKYWENDNERTKI